MVKGLIGVRILTERKQFRVKISPGRPSLTKSVYKNKWEFTHRIQWALNEQALAEAAKTDGIFPLVTNTVLEAGAVLRKYKDQPFLEKRIYTKKTVLEVAPVFLKKEKRIEAMLFLYFVALMIVSLIERKIRMNMAIEQVEKLPILPQGMNSKSRHGTISDTFFETSTMQKYFAMANASKQWCKGSVRCMIQSTGF
jgi:transposase